MLTLVTTMPEANVLFGDSYGASGLNLNATPLFLHSRYSCRLTVVVYINELIRRYHYLNRGKRYQVGIFTTVTLVDDKRNVLTKSRSFML